MLTSAFQEPTTTLPNNGFYNENLTYDLNGNIITLQRFQRPVTGTTAMKIDELKYTYTANSNLLKTVKDSGNDFGYPKVSGGIITYDANGNMITMPDKGISSIAYNYLNLPKQITQTAGNTVYRADGLKIKKVFGSKTTDYLDGFQYVNGVLQFMLTAEGF